MTTGLTINNTQNGQIVFGSAKDDTITNSGNVVVVHGAGGNDSITSSGSSDTIYGGTGTNTVSITGGTQNHIYAGNGSINDVSSSNTLFTLALGNHNDTLGNHDILVARDGTSTVTGHSVTTVVNNFAAGDTIELSTSHGTHLVTSANLSSIITSHIADNASGNAVLTLGGETITFTGVHTSALTTSEFTLVA